MKEERIVSVGTGAATKDASKDESRSRGVEYIFARFEHDKSNYVRNVLNETKPRLEKTDRDKNG